MGRHSFFSYAAFIVFALVFGLTVARFVMFAGSHIFTSIGDTGGRLVKVIEETVASASIPNQKASVEAAINVAGKQHPRIIEPEFLEIPASGKFIAADLGAKTVTLYQDGKQVAQMPILTIGKSGTAWETPRGLYKTQTRERNHFSTIGNVYMPYSMQFNGNYFIHGETYYPNGELVSASFSGGCIKLKTEDAKIVFEFAPIGTPVFVNGGEVFGQVGSEKMEVLPSFGTGAHAYLVADLRSGEVLLEKNAREKVSIGALSRLATALVTLDVINFFNETRVKTTGPIPAATMLLPGQKIQVKELLYPLLFGDRGAAAETIVKIVGQNNFVDRLNERARSVALLDTKFTNPGGNSDSFSTADDLFRLSRHVFFYKNYLWDITKKAEARSGLYRWINQNSLSDAAGFQGGIIGNASTSEGGILIQKVADKYLALIVLGSANVNTDLKNLAKHVAGSFQSEEEKIVATTTILAFVGDIMLDRGVEQVILSNGRGDYSWPFARIDRISKADILFGNLEGPVSDRGRDLGGAYSFRMDPKAALALKSAGFDILSVANNHAGDWGTDAFADSITRLDQNRIAIIGGGQNYSQAALPDIILRNGLKIGWLGFTDVGPAWLAAGSTTAGILLASDPRAAQIISQAAKQTDVLIVSFHFGEEYQTAPNWRQKQLAKMAIDNGAKIVVGHHPHVVQPVERYNGGVIMYSLGNFIFDQYFSTSTMQGLAVKISLNGKNIDKVEQFKSKIDWMFRVSVE